MTGAVNQGVVDYAASRGVNEVLHFTTNRGIVGILSSNAVHARDNLNQEDQLGSVKLLNCVVRKDPEWTGYINMSISSVNKRMLETSKSWHPTDDIWWAVLSFKPEILGHPEVTFTTTNNTYTNVKRGQGVAGLQGIFAPSVPWGWYGSVSTRSQSTPNNASTNDQAEVLYPGSLPLEYLRAIYTPGEDHIDQIESWFDVFENTPRVPVESRPEIFQ